MAGAHRVDGVRDRAAAYAALVRAPNLLTAPPDVLLGAALAMLGANAGGGAGVSAGRVAGLSLASMLLYGAGTALNDYADAPVDAVERPERPVPSGAVSPRAALSLGVGLLGAGVAVAFAAGGARSAGVAAALAAAVALYDFPLKGTAGGFLVMGGARGLNVVLGATAAGGAVGVPPLALAVPALAAGYVAAVTWMAADEATGGDGRRALVTRVATWLVALAVPALGVALDAPPANVGLAAAVAAAFLASTDRPLRAARRSPTPERLGPAVGACVLGLTVLDAAFAALAGLGWAAVVLGFRPAASALSRRFDVS